MDRLLLIKNLKHSMTKIFFFMSLLSANIYAKPNIILIFVDDLGYCDSEIYGCEEIKTPNIKKLADSGVSFSAGYVTSPVCSPSRASLLTGKYQQRFGHEFLPDAVPQKKAGLPIDQITIADKLQDLGYVTGLVGKWHLGTRDEYHPLNRGFDYFYGLLTEGSDYLDPTNPDARIIYRKWRGEYPPRINSSSELWSGRDSDSIFENKEKLVEERYLTDAFTSKATSFISEHKSEPFFLYLPYTAPHGPLQTTQYYYDKYKSVKNESQRIYAAMIDALDSGIGVIIDTLEQHDLINDTLIFLISDNGGGVADYGSNFPFRLGKHTLFEGGVRVPFVMSWPNKIKKYSVYDNSVSTLDVFPTIINATGAKLNFDNLDGVDLLPYLNQPNKKVPHETLYWRQSPNWAIRDGEYKLIHAGGINWLYDLSKDVGEVENIAKKSPHIVEALTDKYKEWDAELSDPAWPPRSAKTHSALSVDGIDMKWTL